MKRFSLWDTRVDELKAMAGKIPAPEIAAHYGVTRKTISHYGSKFGISFRMPPGTLVRAPYTRKQKVKTTPSKIDASKLWMPTSTGR